MQPSQQTAVPNIIWHF